VHTIDLIMLHKIKISSFFIITTFFIILIWGCKKDPLIEKPNVNINQPVDTNGNNNLGLITINISNIKDIKGKMNIALYNSSESFNKPNEAYKELFIIVNSYTMVAKFENIPPGNYAFALFHDENSNDILDQNLLMIPKEGFAFSNNAMGTFGPPSWDKAKFVLSENSSIVQDIELRFF
jgi:uncharacterized protein (DUF2141 family)